MYLENIQSPKDVKVLTMKQLHELAQEIRNGILNHRHERCIQLSGG